MGRVANPIALLIILGIEVIVEGRTAETIGVYSPQLHIFSIPSIILDGSSLFHCQNPAALRIWCILELYSNLILPKMKNKQRDQGLRKFPI
jgi:hypothetical protein